MQKFPERHPPSIKSHTLTPSSSLHKHLNTNKPTHRRTLNFIAYGNCLIHKTVCATDASKLSKHQSYLTFMTDKSGTIPRGSRLLVFCSHTSQLHQHAAAVHCILNSHFLDQMLQVSVINNITQEHAVKSRPHEHSAVAGIIG